MHTRAEWERPSDESNARLWQEPEPGLMELFNKDWLLRLAQRLQTTLHLEELIRVYAAEAAGIIPFDNAMYHNREQEITLEYGERARHICTYKLVVLKQDLGTLTYTRSRPFSHNDTLRLEYLTSQLLFPLRNALLYRDAVAEATKDPLTHVNNRSALDETLSREISLAERHGTPLTVLMLDLDHFKNINDRHGHVVGDYVLKAFVERLGECVRAGDSLYRYGGEEFTLLLRNTDLDGGTCLAERIRECVASRPMDTDAGPVELKVSIGAAELLPDNLAATLLARADAALYRAKAAGRNRVAVARD